MTKGKPAIIFFPFFGFCFSSFFLIPVKFGGEMVESVKPRDRRSRSRSAPRGGRDDKNRDRSRERGRDDHADGRLREDERGGLFRAGRGGRVMGMGGGGDPRGPPLDARGFGGDSRGLGRSFFTATAFTRIHSFLTTAAIICSFLCAHQGWWSWIPARRAAIGCPWSSWTFWRSCSHRASYDGSATGGSS